MFNKGQTPKQECCFYDHVILQQNCKQDISYNITKWCEFPLWCLTKILWAQKGIARIAWVHVRCLLCLQIPESSAEPIIWFIEEKMRPAGDVIHLESERTCRTKTSVLLLWDKGAFHATPLLMWQFHKFSLRSSVVSCFWVKLHAFMVCFPSRQPFY